MSWSQSSEQQESLAWLKVMRVEGSYFWAEVIPDNACATSSCGASGVGCQTNAFARLLTKAPLLKLSCPVHTTLEVNDQVLVSFAENRLFQMSLWVYGGSLFALILGVAVGQGLSGDGLGLLLGLIALLLTWIGLNRYFLIIQPQIKEVKAYPLEGIS